MTKIQDNSSADEIVVVVEVESEASASVIETLRSKDDVGAGGLLGLATVLNEGEGLELFDGSRCCVLLSPVEGVILLGHLET